MQDVCAARKLGLTPYANSKSFVNVELPHVDVVRLYMLGRGARNIDSPVVNMPAMDPVTLWCQQPASIENNTPVP